MFNFIENILLFLSFIISFMIIGLKNPVQSLLSLVLLFMLSSVIFMGMGVEFMSILIFMVYIGAIAVLFLFVIMMLNIKIVELRSNYLRYLPIGIFLLLFFFFELLLSVYFEFLFYYNNNFIYLLWIDILDFKSNIFLLGYIIYGVYSSFFFVLALILLVALIGSILLIVNWGERPLSYFYKNSKNMVFKSIIFLK